MKLTKKQLAKERKAFEKWFDKLFKGGYGPIRWCKPSWSRIKVPAQMVAQDYWTGWLARAELRL